MNLHLRRAVPLLLLLLGSGCASVTPPGTHFASAPSGARVLVDGRDSGWVTPCALALDRDASHEVTLTYPGYAPRSVRLEPAERVAVVSWHQGVNGAKSVVRFPMLLHEADLLVPVRFDGALAPGRVFVRLRPQASP